MIHSMNSTKKRPKRNRLARGSAMLSVLLVAAVLAVLGAASLTLAMGSVQRVAVRKGIDRAYYAAEASALLFAEKAACMAAQGEDIYAMADAATDHKGAQLTAPYTVDYAARGTVEGDTCVVRAYAAVGQAECVVVMVLDGDGRVVSLGME